MHMLLGSVEPAVIRAFTKENQCIDLQIKTYNFAVIPNFRYTHIIEFKGKNICQHSNLAYPLSHHIMISRFMSFDPNSSLDLIHHEILRCILSPNQEKHQKPITCIFYFDLTLHKIFITHALSPLIFSSLYSFSLYQYLRPKQHLEPMVFLDGIKYLLIYSILWVNTMVWTLGIL